MENHHQCKLQQVLTTTCASGVFSPVDGRKPPPVQGAKVRTASGQVGAGSRNNMQFQLPPPLLTRSGPAQVPLECPMQQSMQLVQGHTLYPVATCPYAIYNDSCIGHSNSTRAGPDLVGGGGCCSFMLLLHPATTCPGVGPTL